MTETIMENWNARIGPGDIVYHLGDFALSYGKKDAAAIDDILAHLNGNKFLITGNHDRDEVTKNKRWIKVLPYHEIKVDLGVETPQRINMFHYSMRTWNQQGRGSWALYGHSHGNLPQPPGKCMDVGVDPNYFTPLNIMTIKCIMDNKPIFIEDHHGEKKKV